MKRAFAGRRAWVAYAAAAIVGLALGSYQYLVPASGKIEGVAASTSGIAGAAASQSPAAPVSSAGRAPVHESGQSTGNTGPRQEDDAEPYGLVVARDGLVLRPALTGDRFIGFLVVRNDSDRRFSVGDIIVSVNDRPVENSAAGSELLIAYLANPDAPVEIYSKDVE